MLPQWPPENTSYLGSVLIEREELLKPRRVRLTVQLWDLPNGRAITLTRRVDRGEEPVVEGAGLEVPDLVGVVEEPVAHELVLPRQQPDQVHLVLLLEAEGSGEEGGGPGVRAHVGDAPRLVLEAAVDDAAGSALHFSRSRR